MRKARRFHCQPESVSGARRFVADQLRDQPGEIIEAAELMTSELATNCLRHARSEFELAIHLSGEEMRVELSDYGQGEPVLRSPTPRELSGRGLLIVQQLSEDWGVSASPNGKLVWFTLPLRTDAGEQKRCAGVPRATHPEQSRGLERSREKDRGESRSRLAELRPPRWPFGSFRERGGCYPRTDAAQVCRVPRVGNRTPTQGSAEADRGLVNSGWAARWREILAQRDLQAPFVTTARSIILPSAP